MYSYISKLFIVACFLLSRKYTTNFYAILFRLIVVAEKQVVYNKFPIPLINRLEKHFLAKSTMLTEEQIRMAEGLQKWAEAFADDRVDNFKKRSLFQY